VRKERSGILTGAGGDLLRQLLTGRCVAVHGLVTTQSFPTTGTSERRYGGNAKQRGQSSHAVCIGAIGEVGP
jgi:hypothetical protein